MHLVCGRSGYFCLNMDCMPGNKVVLMQILFFVLPNYEPESSSKEWDIFTLACFCHLNKLATAHHLIKKPPQMAFTIQVFDNIDKNMLNINFILLLANRSSMDHPQAHESEKHHAFLTRLYIHCIYYSSSQAGKHKTTSF